MGKNRADIIGAANRIMTNDIQGHGPMRPHTFILKLVNDVNSRRREANLDRRPKDRRKMMTEMDGAEWVLKHMHRSTRLRLVGNEIVITAPRPPTKGKT